jgi:aconitase A
VCIPLITGQTWFTVPETVQFRLVGKPPRGVGGKDTILYLLGQFKRNTVGADRIAEFTGPGVAHLSCDARFAIANMCTVGFFAFSPSIALGSQHCRNLVP